MRRALILAPCVLNLIACAVFFIVRPPATDLIEERERAQRLGSLTLSSSDPYMLIAERPLRQWNEWHGGESTWVKIIEVLDGPALIATKAIGDGWATSHAFSGTPTYGRESWVRAYVFVVASSVQWLLMGALIVPLIRRRGGAQLATTQAAASSAPLSDDAKSQ
jgi:hypothetical protein